MGHRDALVCGGEFHQDPSRMTSRHAISDRRSAGRAAEADQSLRRRSPALSPARPPSTHRLAPNSSPRQASPYTSPRWAPMLGAHADWSKDANKRWYATAALEADGHYLVSAPSMVGCLSSYFRRLRGNLEADAAVLAGFDFPIGLPAQYAAKVGLSNFVDALPRFGRGEWDDSYCPAPSRSRISTKGASIPSPDGGTCWHRRWPTMRNYRSGPSTARCSTARSSGHGGTVSRGPRGDDGMALRIAQLAAVALQRIDQGHDECLRRSRLRRRPRPRNLAERTRPALR